MKSKELDVLMDDDFIIAAQQLLRLLLAFSCFFEVKIPLRPYDIRTTSNLIFVHSEIQFQLDCVPDVVFHSWWSKFFVHWRD